MATLAPRVRAPQYKLPQILKVPSLTSATPLKIEPVSQLGFTNLTPGTPAAAKLVGGAKSLERGGILGPSDEELLAYAKRPAEPSLFDQAGQAAASAGKGGLDVINRAANVASRPMYGLWSGLKETFGGKPKSLGARLGSLFETVTPTASAKAIGYGLLGAAKGETPKVGPGSTAGWLGQQRTTPSSLLYESCGMGKTWLTGQGTGSKLARGSIGLVADIAGDPLTYATLGTG